MALVASAQSGVGSLNLQDGNNFLNNAANKYIVKPRTAKGIGGFVFQYEGEDSVTYQSDITDHYIETNDPIQDHIAQRPVKIVLRGFVSELVLAAPQGILGALSTIQNKLTTVPGYLGKYTPGALAAIQRGVTQAQTTVNVINNSIAKVQNIVGMLPGATPQKSKQQQAFAQLTALWQTRQTFTVETPWRYFDSMTIESLSFIQPEDTKTMTDISITLKEMRFVETTTVPNNGTFQARAALQRSGQVQQGKTQGTEKPQSLLLQGFKALKAI